MWCARGVSFSFGYFSLRQVREKYLGHRDQPRLVVAVRRQKIHLTLPSPERRGRKQPPHPSPLPQGEEINKKARICGLSKKTKTEEITSW